MHYLERAWYQKVGWLILLWPVTKLFQLLSAVRKFYYVSIINKSSTPLPIIVVGNITVGGTGKTPFIIKLGKVLQEANLKPGIISRGYLSKAPYYPFCVTSDSDVDEVGDEAMLTAKNLDCPVVIDPDRVRALEKICKEFDCDVILSDDGLQHYALPRDIEIAIVDGERLFGNGMCLPAGPLREPISRLKKMNHIIVNGDIRQDINYPELKDAVTMALEPTFLINMLSGKKKPFRGAPFNIGTTIHGVTGIGNPNRFFEMLSKLPYELELHEFPDHHPFTGADFEKLAIDDHQPIVMTEKDAVKCQGFATPNFWYLAVNTNLPEEFQQQLVTEVKNLCKQRNSK